MGSPASASARLLRSRLPKMLTNARSAAGLRMIGAVEGKCGMRTGMRDDLAVLDAEFEPAGPIYIEDIKVGMERSRSKRVTGDCIATFGDLSGDRNPVHFCEDYASKSIFGGVIAHGMLSAGLISAVIGEELPGHGAVYLGQTLNFRAPVRPGDLLTAKCRVAEVNREKRRIVLDCAVYAGENAETLVLEGQAKVLAPSRGAAASRRTRAGDCANASI